jgi:hypothetical protein
MQMHLIPEGDVRQKPCYDGCFAAAGGINGSGNHGAKRVDCRKFATLLVRISIGSAEDYNTRALMKDAWGEL